MEQRKAYLFDVKTNKIRHTYINPDDPKGINKVLGFDDSVILMNLLIKDELYLFIGQKNCKDKRGVILSFNDEYYNLQGSILCLCVNQQKTTVLDAKVNVSDLSNIGRFITDPTYL
jgi:hypothetical protein